MIQWSIAKAAISNFLPWKKIGYGILIAGALAVAFFVFKYIRDAESNRNKVENLETAVTELTAANVALEAEHKNQLRVVQNALKAEREREKTYAENIRILREGPDGSCALNSPAIGNSMRMRRERRAGDDAR